MFLSRLCFSQQRPDSVKTKRLKIFVATSAVSYGGALIGLNELWYSKFPREDFHFFDDLKEWNQVDKAGHFYSAFQISHFSYNALQWAGVKDKKARFWGSLTSILVLTPIEILDGFSSEFGASLSDFSFNIAGAALFYTQMTAWNEIRIHPKFSFSGSGLASSRPDVLGKNLPQRILKDYNGQTYWLSFDLDKFMHSQSKFPKWLNVAVGYGANDMIFANKSSNLEAGLNPVSEYYLSIDFDLNHIKTHSRFLNSIIYVLNLIHLPAPAIEYNKTDGIRFHGIFF